MQTCGPARGLQPRYCAVLTHARTPFALRAALSRLAANCDCNVYWHGGMAHQPLQCAHVRALTQHVDREGVAEALAVDVSVRANWEAQRPMCLQSGPDQC